MYTIIGADHKEYGPVAGDQIGAWIREGRANGETRAKAEGSDEWRPLSSFPEFAEFLASAPRAFSGAAGARAGAPPETLLARDYDLDIGSCLERGWLLVKGNAWPVLGATLLIFILSAVVSEVVSSIIPFQIDLFELRAIPTKQLAIWFFAGYLVSPIQSVAMAWLFKYLLNKIRNPASTLSEAFSEMLPSLGQIILLTYVQSFLSTLASCFCVAPGIYLWVAWFFALPLVVDRKMSFWPALDLSRRVVSKHWFLVLGFMLVLGLISISGVIACGVGVFVTMPIAFAAMMCAYEDMFGAPPSSS